MSLLPPCRFTCKRNDFVQRTNYQTLIWKNSHAQFPEIPDPKSHGWKGMNWATWTMTGVNVQLFCR